ncbi:uncharacterized protein V6R79_006528 [Siganus canaliculatus]
MIGRHAAFILLSTLSLIHTMDIPLQMPLTVAELGDNLTLTCPVSGDETGLFYWYKMKTGHMIQTVAQGSVYKISLQGNFNNPRFSVTTKDSLHRLSIQNISKLDEATYFCQSGAVYVMTFTNATLLVVNGRKNEQNIVYVKQSPERTSVEPGGSTTLHCSLLSENKEPKDQYPEHSVYWFRSGSEGSHPSIMYSHKSHSDEQEGRSCVHSLSQTIRNETDSGTYYCAVVTCGRILFGEGTTVETRSKLYPVILVLGALLFCCVIVIIVLSYFIKRQKHCDRSEGEMSASLPPGHHKTTVDQASDLDNDAAALNYAALNFTTRKLKKEEKKRKLPEDCVYSVVRADYHNNQQPSQHIDQDL